MVSINSRMFIGGLVASPACTVMPRLAQANNALTLLTDSELAPSDIRASNSPQTLTRNIR